MDGHTLRAVFYFEDSQGTTAFNPIDNLNIYKCTEFTEALECGDTTSINVRDVIPTQPCPGETTYCFHNTQYGSTAWRQFVGIQYFPRWFINPDGSTEGAGNTIEDMAYAWDWTRQDESGKKYDRLTVYFEPGTFNGDSVLYNIKYIDTEEFNLYFVSHAHGTTVGFWPFIEETRPVDASTEETPTSFPPHEYFKIKFNETMRNVLLELAWEPSWPQNLCNESIMLNQDGDSVDSFKGNSMVRNWNACGYPISTSFYFAFYAESSEWWDMLNTHPGDTTSEETKARPEHDLFGGLLSLLSSPQTQDLNGTRLRPGHLDVIDYDTVGVSTAHYLMGDTAADYTPKSEIFFSFMTAPIRIEAEYGTHISAAGDLPFYSMSACNGLTAELGNTIDIVTATLLDSDYDTADIADISCSEVEGNTTASCSIYLHSMPDEESYYYLRYTAYYDTTSRGFDQMRVMFTVTGDSDDDDLDDDLELITYGTSPCIPDTDLDGLDDYIESITRPCLGPNNSDTDDDGLCDGNTTIYDGSTLICIAGEDLDLDGYGDTVETDPCDPDTDDDGMDDGWEVIHTCMDALNGDSTLDGDTDGLSNIYEYNHSMDPCNDDTDDDGLEDGEEVGSCTDPLNPDTDGDGICDGVEYYYGTDPCHAGWLPIMQPPSGGSNGYNYTRITDPGDDSQSPSIAWTGSEFGISWTLVDGGTQVVYFNRIDEDGEKKLSNLHVISGGPYASQNQFSSSLRWTGYEFKIAWAMTGEIYSLRLQGISDSGSLVGSPVTKYNHNDYNGNTDADYSFAVGDSYQFGLESIFAWRVGYCDVVTDQGNTLPSTSERCNFSPTITINANRYEEYGTAWVEREFIGEDFWIDRILFSRIQPEYECDPECAPEECDTVCDPKCTLACETGCYWDCVYDTYDPIVSEPIAIDQDAQEPAIIWTGSEYGIFWIDGYDYGVNIKYARVSIDGQKIGSSKTIVSYPDALIEPFYASLSACWAGDKSYFAWSDSRNDNYFDIYISALDGTGHKIMKDYRMTHTLGISPALTCSQWGVAVAWNSIYDGIYFSNVLFDGDGDGATDKDEDENNTDAHDPDSDDDGMDDGWELQHPCLDPMVGDSLEDGDTDEISNLLEYMCGTDPCEAVPDTDGDGMTDLYECTHGLDGDSAGDRFGDFDEDGVANIVEYAYGTDADNPDSDGDGMSDYFELKYMACGLDPKYGDSLLDGDTDGLTNLEEQEEGTNPCLKDSDGDGDSDSDEIDNGTDPTLYESPIVFMVVPPIAKPGDTVTIFGNRFGHDPFNNTTVTINGEPADILEGSTENMLYVNVASGSSQYSSSYPGLMITAWYGSTLEIMQNRYPIKITKTGEVPQEYVGITQINVGDTVYGMHRPGETDGYRLHLSGKSSINISVKGFDPLSNGDTTRPDTFLMVRNKFGDIVATDDNSGGSTYAKIEALVLPGDTAYIIVTVPHPENGDTCTGFYSMRIEEAAAAPYITSVSPAIGLAGDVITIEGMNFGDTADSNEVSFMDGNTATISSATETKLTVVVPTLPGSQGHSYPIVIDNLDSSLSSDDSGVADHNSGALFYHHDPDNLRAESAYTATELKTGDTATGFIGTERGKFSFAGSAGKLIEVEMLFADTQGNVLTAGEPEVSLIAPDGSDVSSLATRPASWTSTTDGVLHDQFALPQTGDYTLVAGGTCSGCTAIEVYKLSYDYQDPIPVDAIQKIAGDDQIIPVVRNGTTLFDDIEVHLIYQGSTVPDAPVIFRAAGKEYLAFTDSDGNAAHSGIATPSPEKQGVIAVYPAGYAWIKAEFRYIVIYAFSRDDWDGDGITNSQEVSSGTNPTLLDSNYDGIMDGYPLSGDTSGDNDGDRLPNEWEIVYGTDMHNLDSDDDGFPDGMEVMFMLNRPSVSIY